MFKKVILLALVWAFVATTAQAAVFITGIAHRNTAAGAPEMPQIAPSPLAEDSPVFVDRVHQYNVIPAYLIGADYVMLANDNKGQSTYELDVTLGDSATLYLFIDNRMGGAAGGLGVAPNITGMPWVTNLGFTDTGDDIGIDEGADGDIDQYSSIFSLSVKKGTITLGGNTQGHGGNMLGVAALGPKLKAHSPVPADGAIHADTWVSLGWTAGVTAASHDVYLGDSFADVNDGAAGAFRGNQTTTFFVAGFPGFPYPEGLVPGTTYYWRIDEIEADGTTIYRGNVWSFTVPPKKAYNPAPADGAEAVALNATLTWTAGFGAKLHTVYFGDNFDTVANAAGAPPQGAATYSPSGLKMAKTYYWRVDEFDGTATHKGDIWSFSTTGGVGGPNPANGAVDVSPAVTLTWRAGGLAASHEVYFGIDADAVKNATKTSPEYKGSKTLGDESYAPGTLKLQTAYYWRIDEVNAVNPDSPWKGNVWTFTTGNFFVVDDFEGYNAGANQIWYAWHDGLGYGTPGTPGYFAGNGTGAAVGDETTASFTEQTIIHGGKQAMPINYDNNKQGKAKYSEAEFKLTAPRDWTADGVGELSLWFRGIGSNAAEPLYVAVSNATGQPAVVTHPDPKAAQLTTWTEWVIPLSGLQGITLNNVDKIAVGLGTRGNMTTPGGAGKMYFDDIRLYRPRTAP